MSGTKRRARLVFFLVGDSPAIRRNGCWKGVSRTILPPNLGPKAPDGPFRVPVAGSEGVPHLPPGFPCWRGPQCSAPSQRTEREQQLRAPRGSLFLGARHSGGGYSERREPARGHGHSRSVFFYTILFARAKVKTLSHPSTGPGFFRHPR